jgi:hypothetical protein
MRDGPLYANKYYTILEENNCCAAERAWMVGMNRRGQRPVSRQAGSTYVGRGAAYSALRR